MPFRFVLAAFYLPFRLVFDTVVLPWGATMALADSHSRQKAQLRAKIIKPKNAPSGGAGTGE